MEETEIDRVLERDAEDIERYRRLISDKKYDEANDLYMQSEGVQLRLIVDEAVAVHIQSRQKRRMTGREAYEANSYLRSRALRDAFCEVSYKIARESIYETSFILQEGG